MFKCEFGETINILLLIKLKNLV